MYGHAVAVLHDRGFDIGELVGPATEALAFLLERRARSDDGLVLVCHPWESGCDDSPRWDHFRPDPAIGAWRRRKAALVHTIERTATGAPVRNPEFLVASAGFNALVAFNATELAGVTGDRRLAAAGAELCEALDARWDGSTWADAGEHAATTGSVPTLDSLLPALLGGAARAGGDRPVHRPADLRRSVRPPWRVAAGGRLRPQRVLARAGVAAALLPVVVGGDQARRRRARPPLASGGTDGAATAVAVAGSLARTTLAGAEASGWAEYWDPDTGAGHGARPQSWSALAAVMSDQRDPRRT